MARASHFVVDQRHRHRDPVQRRADVEHGDDAVGRGSLAEGLAPREGPRAQPGRSREVLVDDATAGRHGLVPFDPSPSRAPAGQRVVQLDENEQSGPNAMEIMSWNRTQPDEFFAEMRLLPARANAGYEHVQVRETFGPVQAIPGRLLDSDLRRAPGVPTTVADVLRRCYAVRPDQRRDFRVRGGGIVDDYHGGSGFPDGYETWFTPAALNRGLGTFVERSYWAGPALIGRFRIDRIVRTYTVTDSGDEVDATVDADGAAQGQVDMTKTLLSSATGRASGRAG